MPKRWGNKLPKIKLPLTKPHLQTMRGLTQFERCWIIIDSHIALYDSLERLSKRMSDSIKHREGGHDATA